MLPLFPPQSHLPGFEMTKAHSRSQQHSQCPQFMPKPLFLPQRDPPGLLGEQQQPQWQWGHPMQPPRSSVPQESHHHQRGLPGKVAPGCCSLPPARWLFLPWWYQSPGWHQNVQDLELLLPKKWEKPIWGWGMKGGEKNNPTLSVWCWGGFDQSCPVPWGDTGWGVTTSSRGHTGTYWAHGHSSQSVTNSEKSRATLVEHSRALWRS